MTQKKEFLKNPYFKLGFPQDRGVDPTSTNVDAVKKLLDLCPKAEKTPLIKSEVLSKKMGVKNIWFKDERERMGLGSFKALGATYVIASHAAEKVSPNSSLDEWKSSLSDRTYISASAGNHGLSLAAGARLFGANAVIYLSKNVPSTFAERIKDYGADVVIYGNDYEESLEGAKQAADSNKWFLLSDVTWDGYDHGLKVMEGYLAMAAEAFDECIDKPTHIFLQAGVGGFPASVATLARKYYGNEIQIIIVEPTKAPVLLESIRAGKAVTVTGGVSNMGRLDCKNPSTKALSSLAITCTHFMTIADEDASNAVKELKANNLNTSPSGAAGYAAITDAKNFIESQIDQNSNILLFLTEKPA